MEEVMSQEPESDCDKSLVFINPKFEMILERSVVEENSFCSSKPFLNCPSGVQRVRTRYCNLVKWHWNH